MSKMAAHSSNLIEIVCFVVISMAIADKNRVTSTSDSGNEHNVLIYQRGYRSLKFQQQNR